MDAPKAIMQQIREGAAVIEYDPHAPTPTIEDLFRVAFQIQEADYWRRRFDELSFWPVRRDEDLLVRKYDWPVL